MSRGKAPPFKQRVQAALEAARAAGSARLKIKTADGAEYQFDLIPAAESPEVTPFPPYTSNYRDRHGKWRSEFRRGGIRVPLPEPLLGPEYWEAYRAALADYIAGRDPARRSEIAAARTQPGTVTAGFVAYIGSAALKERSQREHTEGLFQYLKPLAGPMGRSPP